MPLSASGAVVYALVSVHAARRGTHFEHKMLSQYVVELTALLNKPYFSLLCDNSLVRYCVKIKKKSSVM